MIILFLFEVLSLYKVVYRNTAMGFMFCYLSEGIGIEDFSVVFEVIKLIRLHNEP